MQALRFIAIAIYGLCFSLAHAETLTGQVVKIADGDTLIILDATSYREHVILPVK